MSFEEATVLRRTLKRDREIYELPSRDFMDEEDDFWIPLKRR